MGSIAKMVFAEYISMNENNGAFKPKNLSMDEAASIPLVGLTAWHALIEIWDTPYFVGQMVGHTPGRRANA